MTAHHFTYAEKECLEQFLTRHEKILELKGYDIDKQVANDKVDWFKKFYSSKELKVECKNQKNSKLDFLNEQIDQELLNMDKVVDNQGAIPNKKEDEFKKYFYKVLALNDLMFQVILEIRFENLINETKSSINGQLQKVDTSINNFQDSIESQLHRVDSAIDIFQDSIEETVGSVLQNQENINDSLTKNFSAILFHYNRKHEIFIGSGFSVDSFSFDFINIKFIQDPFIVNKLSIMASFGSSYLPNNSEEFGFSFSGGLNYNKCVGIEFGGFKLNNKSLVPTIEVHYIHSMKNLFSIHLDRRRGVGLTYLHSFHFSE